MTSHELARALLELPDLPTIVNDERGGEVHEVEEPFLGPENEIIIPVNCTW